MIAGILEVQLQANMARLVQDMDTAKRTVGGAMANIEKTVESAKRALEALGVGLAGRHFVSLIKESIEAADQLGKMSQKVGMTVESLSALKYSAALSDVSFDQLGKGMEKLSKNMLATAQGAGSSVAAIDALGVSAKGGAAGAFAQLNINVEASKGHLKSSEQIFLEVADKFAGMKDGAVKTADAMAIFGKSGADLIPLLNQGAAAIEAQRVEAEKLGIVMSKEMAEGAEKFDDDLKKLHFSSQAFTIHVANELLPKLDDISKKMVEVAKQSGFWASILAGIGGLTIAAFGGETNEVKRLDNDINAMFAKLLEQKKMLAAKEKNGSGIGFIDSWLWGDQSSYEKTKSELDDLLARRKALMGAEPKTPTPKIDPVINNPQVAASTAAYDGFMKSLREKIALEEAEAAAGGKLTDAQKFQIDLESKLAEILKTTTPAQAAAAKAEVARAEALHAANLETERQNNLRADEYKNFVAYTDELEKETKSLVDGTKSMREGNQEMGLTNDALLALKQARIDATEATLQMTLKGTDETHQTNMEAEAIRNQIAALEDRKKAMGEANEASKTLDAMKQQADMWKTIDSTAQQTFVSIFNSGKSAFDRLRDTLKNGLYALLYEMTLKKWLINIAASVSGGGVAQQAFGASNMAQAGGGMGSLGGLGGIASMGTSWEGFGSSIGTATGSGWAGYAAEIGGQALGYANALMAARDGQWGKALGSAVGTYFGGPIGSVIGSTVGGWIDSAFGGHGGAKIGADVTANGMGSRQTWSNSGGDALNVAALAGQAFDKLNSVASALGGKVNGSLMLGYDLDPRGSAPGWINYGAGGSMNRYQINGQDTQAAATELQAAASRAVLLGLQSADLPAYLASALRSANASTATSAEIDATISFATALKQVHDQLYETRSPLEIAKANIASLGTSVESYTADFKKAMEAGMTPEVLARWQALGTTVQTIADANLNSAYEKASASIKEMKLLTVDSFSNLLDYTRYMTLAANAGISGAAANLAPNSDTTFIPGKSNSNDSNKELVSSVDNLRKELQSGQIALATYMSETAKILRRWNGDGMPAVRTV